MARSDVAKKTIREDATGVDFNFSDGTVVPVEIANLPDVINYKNVQVNTLHLFACHGLSQKIGDSYAGVAGVVADAIENAKATWEIIMGGDWSEAKAGAVVRAPSRIVNAFMRVLTRHSKAFDEAALKEKAKDKTWREKAMENAEVKAEYDAIALEEATAKAQASKAAALEAPASNLDELAA